MDYKELDVWKKSIELVETMYKISAKFPSSEVYGLTNQIRRASVSVSSNIAEGAGRSGDKELLYFLNVALGSLAEVETQVEIALRLNFISTADSIADVTLEKDIKNASPSPFTIEPLYL